MVIAIFKAIANQPKNCMRRSYFHRTVEPRFTDTRLIRTRRYYGQFSLSLGKACTFSLNSTRFRIRTPVNGETGHLFLAQ